MKIKVVTFNVRIDSTEGYTERFKLIKEKISAESPDVICFQEAVDKMASGEFTSFTGPIYKQDGTIAFEEGVVATEAEVDGMDYFVEGIIGNDN